MKMSSSLWAMALGIYFLFFSILSSDMSVAVANSSDTPQVFIIEAIGGSDFIIVKREKSKISLKKGQELHLGDIIETDSRMVVDIRYPDHTLVRVGVNSNFTIENKNPNQKDLVNDWVSKLVKGVIRVLVPETNSKNKNIKYQVNTPSGTMGVRGTEFVVAHVGKKTVLHTLKGEVLLGAANVDFSDTAKFVVVAKGKTSSVNIGEAPTSPKEFSLEEYLKQIDAANEKNPFHALHARRSGVVAKTNKLSKKINTPVATRISTDNNNMLAKLIEIRNEEEKKDKSEKIDPNDLFINALIKGDIITMDKAVADGAEPEFELSGKGPAHIAVLKNESVPILMKLKELGINFNRKDKNGYTPLMMLASEKDNVKAAELLISYGADPNLIDKEGKTALDHAKSSKHLELEKFLEKVKEEEENILKKD